MKKTLLVLTLLAAIVVSIGIAHAKPSASTDLTGAAEVSGGDPDGSGYALISLSPSTNRLCFDIVVKDIEPATAAHIHKGAPGVDGPVVVTLTPPSGGESLGCVDLDADLFKDIKMHPEDYYVNVHNAEYPDGALRGQLAH
jgi:hypothetical protein